MYLFQISNTTIAIAVAMAVEGYRNGCDSSDTSDEEDLEENSQNCWPNGPLAKRFYTKPDRKKEVVGWRISSFMKSFGGLSVTARAGVGEVRSGRTNTDRKPVNGAEVVGNDGSTSSGVEDLESRSSSSPVKELEDEKKDAMGSSKEETKG